MDAKRTMTSWLLVAIGVVAATQPVHAIIISASQNMATRGRGMDPADFFKGVGMVGRLDANNNDSRNYFCTGTLIQPPADQPQTKKFVLTAAHCTFDNAFDIRGGQDYPGDYPPSPSEEIPSQYPYPSSPRLPYAPPPGSPVPFLGAYPQNKMTFTLPLEAAGVHYKSTKVTRHPNYVAGDSTYDIAIIELEAEVASTAWKINGGEIADERAAALVGLGYKVGYGAGGDGANGEKLLFGNKRQGVNMVDRFDGMANQLMEFDFDNHAIDPLTNAIAAIGPTGGTAIGQCDNNLLPIWNRCEANTTHGDSGGPMFIRDVTNNMWRVAGVTRGGDSLGMGQGGVGFGEIANDVRVQVVSGWINQNVPEPASIVLVILGLAGSGLSRLKGRCRN